MSTTAYQELLDRAREVHLLGSTAGVLAWDQETKMPSGGVEWRAAQLAQLARIEHDLATAPRLEDLLAACEGDPGLTAAGTDAASNLREIRRGFDRATRLPAALVAEIAHTESLAQHEWAAARADSDFGRFAPWLERMVELMRQKAACIGAAEDQEAWDVLAEGFEPGARAASLQALFADLVARLRPLVDRLLGSGTPPDDAFNRVPLPIDAQERFVRRIAAAIGFDFERGRLDRAAHPFCSGAHPGDVRITTRFRDDNVIDALGSTMHEAGHGIYEQGLPAAHAGTPRGRVISLALHESQSRLWENHVGRSRAFWTFCAPLVREEFGAAAADYDAAEMFGAANKVARSLIRVEADEATYDLHVVVRFELELALIRGELAVADLPEAWDGKMRDILGVEVPDAARGCLQDVHWSCGLFGYFPTYTLGNLYAAQLFEAARAALPDLDAQLARGEFTPLRTWLNEHVHSEGARLAPADLCRHVTGSPLGMEPMMRHLEGKLLPLYRLLT